MAALRFRPLPVLSVFALAALALLIALGAWQWGRWREKLRPHPAPIAETVRGFAPDAEGTQLVFATLDQGAGWRVLVPVKLADGTALFVDSNFVLGVAPPDLAALPPPPAFARGMLKGSNVTPREPSAFAPPGEPTKRTWYWVDLAGMAKAANVAKAAPYYLASPYETPDGVVSQNPFAAGALRDPLPPERHFGYALTWWGLAAALVGVYLAFHARLGRLKLR
jgi:surfeit locus 1 family protein